MSALINSLPNTLFIIHGWIKMSESCCIKRFDYTRGEIHNFINVLSEIHCFKGYMNELALEISTLYLFNHGLSGAYLIIIKWLSKKYLLRNICSAYLIGIDLHCNISNDKLDVLGMTFNHPSNILYFSTNNTTCITTIHHTLLYMDLFVIK